ncbi:MAG: IS200/IS605 family transposase [Bacteroidia bacterium]
MSYVRIWIHAVWGTKNRQPILVKEKRAELFAHIKEHARMKEIYIDTINGYFDHVHCLLALNADMSISKAMNLIKGESSFWANKQNLFSSKLEWADEYYAASVSDSIVDKVRAYIYNQETHHSKTSFVEEYTDFLKQMGYEVMAKANTNTEDKTSAINGGVKKTTSMTI